MNLQQAVKKRVEGIARWSSSGGLKDLVASEMVEAIEEDRDFIFKALALLDSASNTNHASRLRYALEQRDYDKHD